jgi:hypothetical protein
VRPVVPAVKFYVDNSFDKHCPLPYCRKLPMIKELIEQRRRIAVVQFDPVVWLSYGECPLCGDDIGPLPALSRRDNRTNICSDCGLAVAL